jgi:hypothetical protein
MSAQILRPSASSPLVVTTLTQPESSSLKKHVAHDEKSNIMLTRAIIFKEARCSLLTIKKSNMSYTHPLKSRVSDALWYVTPAAEDLRVLGPSDYYSHSTRVIIFKEARCS